jgi:protoheme IX farnesyltransferase
LTVARQIVAYSWLTVASSLVLWPLATGWIYGAVAGLGGAALVGEAYRLWWATRQGSGAKPMRMFHLSNSYLAGVFVAVAVDTFLR